MSDAKTRAQAPLVLFGIPNEDAQRNDYAVEIPGLASLLLTHDINGVVKGIEAFGNEHPPVGPVFWSFRIMVGTGILMLVISWFAALQLRKGREPSTFVARALVSMTFSGWIAVLSGWYTTEIGRQPYLVHGVLTTADAVGPVPGGTVGLTLAVYLTLYAVLTFAYISVVFLLARRAAVVTGSSRPRMPNREQTSKLEPGCGEAVSHA